MKVLKIVIFFIITSILIFLLTGCENKNEEEMLKNRAKSEIDYLSEKFINILNNLNNITFENFDVVSQSSTLTKESASQKKQSTSSSNDGGQQESGGENSQKNQNATGGQSSSGENVNIVTTQMTPNTILNPVQKEPDWTIIKADIENLHETWNTVVVDLYKLNISNDDILAFGSDLDNATVYIKNEDKSNSLLSIAKLYGYLPKYSESISNDNIKKNILQTRSYIINAYSLVDTRNVGRYNKANR